MAQQYKGISFPFRIGVKGGVVMSVANINDFTHIDESIEQLFRTRPFERTMEQDVYSELDTSIFEPNDESLATLIEYQITNALERLEQRIEIQDVEVFSEDSTVFATLTYTVPEFNNNIHVVTIKVGEISE